LRTLAAARGYFDDMSDDATVIDDVFGKRYGEVLLVTSTQAGPEATVYNTFPLNDCPAALWDKLDPQAIAAESGAVAANSSDETARQPTTPSLQQIGRSRALGCSPR
jgi:hypothetical protein